MIITVIADYYSTCGSPGQTRYRVIVRIICKKRWAENKLMVYLLWLNKKDNEKC